MRKLHDDHAPPVFRTLAEAELADLTDARSGTIGTLVAVGLLLLLTGAIALSANFIQQVDIVRPETPISLDLGIWEQTG